MKRTILCLTIVFFTSTAFANVYIDTFGAFIGANDASYQFGGGIALGVDINRNVSFIYRGAYTLATDDSNPYLVKDFSHMTHLAGVEYILNIDAARLGWRSSFQLGFSKTEIGSLDQNSFAIISPVIGFPYMSAQKSSDMGFTIAIWTGIQFYAMQHLAPFIDIGYHHSFYSGSLENKTVNGFHLMFGLRFYILKSRRIKEDY